jgi:hypothetical protein
MRQSRSQDEKVAFMELAQGFPDDRRSVPRRSQQDFDLRMAVIAFPPGLEDFDVFEGELVGARFLGASGRRAREGQ